MSLEEWVHHPFPCCSNNSGSGSLIDPSIMSARTMHDNVNRINRGQKYDGPFCAALKPLMQCTHIA